MPVGTRIASAGNVLVGGVIGMAVDASTGAELEHYPNPVVLNLTPLRKGEAPRVIRRAPPPPAPPATDAGPPQS